ncbi:hypothetical protein LguiB_012874 [Lonicera macranthoides]
MCHREMIGYLYQAGAIVSLDLVNLVLTIVARSQLELACRHYYNQEFELHYNAPSEVQSSENTFLLHEIRHP